MVVLVLVLVECMCVCGGRRHGVVAVDLLIFNLLHICSNDFLHILSNLSQQLENAVTISALRIFLKILQSKRG